MKFFIKAVLSTLLHPFQIPSERCNNIAVTLEQLLLFSTLQLSDPGSFLANTQLIFLN